jgi:hypothetical protein
MKLARSLIAFALCFSLVTISSLTLAVQTAAAQDSKIALQRGYRTGYSDGYMSGYRDAVENASKSFVRHPEYKSADRAYSSDYGSLENYSDGYKQGFEKGYETGYSKNSFNAAIPDSLAYRGQVDVSPAPAETVADISQDVPDNTADTGDVGVSDSDVYDDADTAPSAVAKKATYKDAALTGADQPNATYRTNSSPSYIPSGNEIIIIPAETELVVELLDELDTKVIREGDPFKARVVSPQEISGAIIEGRIAKNRRPGKLKRRAELVLSFDRIVLAKNRWANFNAMILDVLPVRGDNVKRIDNEGTVEGKRPYKSDSIKLGAATGTGLVIGAIVAGPVGAAVGAGVGAAFGVGAVVVERGKYIRLAEQQQLRIKTAYETQIR